MLLELPGKRKRGRPKRRFMDAAREDVTTMDVTDKLKNLSNICRNSDKFSGVFIFHCCNKFRFRPTGNVKWH